MPWPGGGWGIASAGLWNEPAARREFVRLKQEQPEDKFRIVRVTTLTEILK